MTQHIMTNHMTHHYVDNSNVDNSKGYLRRRQLANQDQVWCLRETVKDTAPK